jgi:hypothetical protein
MSIAMLVACAALTTDPAAMASATSTARMRVNRRIWVPYTANPGAVHDGLSQLALFSRLVNQVLPTFASGLPAGERMVHFNHLTIEFGTRPGTGYILTQP